MLTFLNELQRGDEFLDIRTDIVYKIVSEPVNGEVLCADDDGFGEMFDQNTIVRPVS